MSDEARDEAVVTAVVTAVKASRKYGDASEETIRELALEAVQQHKKTKAAVKAVRTRLHSIMAPYLGDPDYVEAARQLDAAFAAGSPAGIKAVCRQALHAHLSTQERLPILETFYEQIFAVTGKPSTIMDIACGLNPLAFPWMGISDQYSVSSDQYSVSGDQYAVSGDQHSVLKFYAYDIHEPRIDFINHYFRLEGLPPLARVQDVALHFPQETADVALFLKEMPRFERNYRGRGRPLLQAIQARWLVISFPTVSTHGGRDLTDRYRAFMAELLDGTDWAAHELLFPGELVYCVQKGG